MTDYWMLIFFNLLFTSAPPVIYGVLEKDVSAETLMQLPELYKSGQKSEVGAKAKLALVIFIVKVGIFQSVQLKYYGTFRKDLKLFELSGYFKRSPLTWQILNYSLLR